MHSRLGIPGLSPVLLENKQKKVMGIPDSEMINEMLPRYCEGMVSEEERQLVEAWISQSEEHYKAARQIHTIYLATDVMDVLSKVDTEKALQQVTQRMTTSRKMSRLAWLQRVAAILFIPVLITLLIQNFYKASPSVQWIEVKTNPGMTTTVNLPDGSVAYLNSESSLSYPVRFEGDVRNVSLKGEAFFSVSKDKKKRFIVSAPHNTCVEVVGTEFNIEAFEKDSVVSTTLLEGRVNFSYTKDTRIRQVSLKPGQKLVYNPALASVQLSTTTGKIETAWKDGEIIFSNTLLPVALHLLGKHYNVEFVITNQRLLKEPFTGFFTHQRLDHILEVFKISSNIKWRYIDTNNTQSEKTRIEIY